MLPSPVSFAPKGRTFKRHVTPRKRVIDVLLSRARATNLAVLLLASLFAISLLHNLRFYYLSSKANSYTASGLLSTITRDKALSKLNHLIVVPGHAIWTGTDPDLRLDEDEWILDHYQRGGGRVAALFAHISRGAELARSDERSLVVFSGGQTRPASTTTEAESYLRLALKANVFRTSSSQMPFTRAATEDHALDSFQNLLFSIARFHEYTGNYPDRITVVGYEFKRSRFTDLHRAAIRWPINKFHYIGVDPETENTEIAKQGERKNGFLPYSHDAYGCHSVLLSKRQQRNPHARFHSYYTSSPELRSLLDWCPSAANGGETILFDGELPWAHS